MQSTTQADAFSLISAPEEGTGFTNYHRDIVKVQLRRIAKLLSPGHACALLELHRISSGKGISKMTISSSSLGTTLGVSAKRAGNILRDLEDENVISIERRRAQNQAHIASVISFKKGWRVPLPYRAKNLSGYISIPNVIPDDRQREIARYANTRAYLVYFVLAARADDSGLAVADRDELARLTAQSKDGVKKSIRELRACQVIENEGFGHGGAEYRLTPNTPAVEPPKKDTECGVGYDTSKGKHEVGSGTIRGRVGYDTSTYKESTIRLRNSSLQPRCSTEETPETTIAVGECENVDIEPRTDGEAVFRNYRAADSELGAHEEATLEKAKGAFAPGLFPTKNKEIGVEETDYSGEDGEYLIDRSGNEYVFDARAWREASHLEREVALDWATMGIVSGALIPPPSELMGEYGLSAGTDVDETVEETTHPDEVGAGDLEWCISSEGLRRFCEALDDKIDPESLQLLIREGYAGFADEHGVPLPEDMSESVIRTVGRCVGAHQRGAAINVAPYIAAALERNLENWRLLEHSAEGSAIAAQYETYEGDRRYGSAHETVEAEVVLAVEFFRERSSGAVGVAG